MAECSECNGDGIIFYPNGTHKICNECGGSGRIADRFNAVDLLEVMGKVKQPLTNEEWFCGLSTEEKAEWIFNDRVEQSDWWYEQQGHTKAEVIEWLKQPHKE